MKSTKINMFNTIDEGVRQSKDRVGWLSRYFGAAVLEIMLVTLTFLTLSIFGVTLKTRLMIAWIVLVTFIAFHFFSNLIPRLFLYTRKFKKIQASMQIEIDNFKKYKALMPETASYGCDRDFVRQAPQNEVKYLLEYCKFPTNKEFQANLFRFINASKKLNKKLMRSMDSIPKITQKCSLWTLCKKLGIAEVGCRAIGDSEFVSIYPHYTFSYIHEDKDYSKDFTVILSPAMASQVLIALNKK